MYYEHRSDLPSALQRLLPATAQHLYKDVFNGVWQSFRERYSPERAIGSRLEVAHRTAWAAVKQQYYKSVTGTWQLRQIRRT